MTLAGIEVILAVRAHTTYAPRFESRLLFVLLIMAELKIGPTSVSDVQAVRMHCLTALFLSASSPLTFRILCPHSLWVSHLMFDKESLWLQWEAPSLYGTQSRQESSAQYREAVRSWACPTLTWSTSKLMQQLM